MADFAELMELFSRPRPSGSAAEHATLEAMHAWLDARGVAYQVHRFRLYPYFFEAAGAWLIASRTLLAAAALRRWGWRALPVALVGQLGGTADIFGLPLVTWPGATEGASLILPFGPPGAERELLICAHYDSKTELLDHRRRAVLLRGLRPGSALTFAAALLAASEGWLRAKRRSLAPLAHALAVATALPVLLLAWALGLNLLLGRLARPSSGAVDDGAACAILLALAARLARGELSPRRTRVTLALFGGEEVNMQGSRAYVRHRRRPNVARSTLNVADALADVQRSTFNRMPDAVVNLELMGQRGGYVLWQRDGNALRTLPTSPAANALIRAAVREVTGAEPHSEPLINSDAYAFLAAGVPAGVLGTRDPLLGTSGLHRPSDTPARVDPARLAEGLAVLEAIIRRFDIDRGAAGAR
ncbi:MAG TPA: M20/M25/M40 family metallo-hydrolase [Roseiflexaceae bacterium]|nr:M20/M25/M40 family metallo-hydrolase [Roseiflexaceae bacterium]